MLIATPGPPARPHRGQELRVEPGRVRRARRGRPHARHRLPARPAAHPVSYLPKHAPDAAVLGHVLTRDQAPGQQLPAGSDHSSRWPAPTPPPPTSSSASTASPTDDKRNVVLPDPEGSQRSRRRWCSSIPSSVARRAWRANRSSATACVPAALHGDKSQDERLKALASFKKPARSTCSCRDRRRRPRPRHRRPARRLQLRRAVQRRRLCAPHRPHRPRRCVWSGGDAGDARRHAARRRHPQADQEADRRRAAGIRRRRAGASTAPRASARCRGGARTGGRRRRARPARAARGTRSTRATRATRHAGNPRYPRSARCAAVHAPARPREQAPRAAADPFFDKPYEAIASDAKPAWEQRGGVPTRGLSPNIKPKKKVAALFGGKVPEEASS